MPIDPTRLKQLIAARRFEDFGRRLQEASAGDLAAIPTQGLLEYLESLSDSARQMVSDSVLDELKRRRPTEVALALELAGRLLLAGLAADARQVIEAALEASEQKGSVALQWILHLLGLRVPSEARAQLSLVCARHLGPMSTALAAAYIDVEEQKFDAAAARLEPVIHRRPELTSVRTFIEYARTCSAIAARFAAARQAHREAPDYAVFAINLDEQTLRFQNLAAQFPADVHALIRIPGVKGRYLPDAAAARLGGADAARQKGTLGCFLAHVAAWERFRASVFDHGLFVEDDVKVAIDLPPSLAALDLPSGYELCFAGYGMEPPTPPGPGGLLHAVPVAATVAAKTRTWNAPGAYGYFLSRRGAERLLDLVARDGFSGDVDWRLIAYSIGKADREGLSPESFAFAALGRHLACIEARPPITGWCLYPPLFVPGRFGSTRMADNIVR
jgi:hypothetical protein